MGTCLAVVVDDGDGLILLAGVECSNVIAQALKPSEKVLGNFRDVGIALC